METEVMNEEKVNFKDGDVVRCIDPGNEDVTEGHIYTAMGTEPGWVSYIGDSGKRAHSRASRFKLVKNPFKIGDRVRYNSEAPDPGKFAGVVKVLGDKWGTNLGTTVTYESGGWDYVSDLEPAARAPKFYVGDRVKFVPNDADPCEPHGLTGNVVLVCGDGDYVVDFDGFENGHSAGMYPGSTSHWYVDEADLEPVVEEQPKATMSTQVGGTHYTDMAIQPYEYITKNGLTFGEGSVVKYVSRHRNKGGRRDLEKARHFIDLLIAEYDEAA